MPLEKAWEDIEKAFENMFTNTLTQSAVQNIKKRFLENNDKIIDIEYAHVRFHEELENELE